MMMLSFNDFLQKNSLRNKIKSSTKAQNKLSSLSLNDVGIFLGDGPFAFEIGIVFWHPTKGRLWVAYIHQNRSESYGCSLPNKLSEFILKRNGYCLLPEYKIQCLTNKKDSYCAVYCLYINYSTEVLRIDFKSAVLIMCH